MSKLVAALKRMTTGTDGRPSVHFHQGMTASHPEVCHEGACERPHLGSSAV